MDKDSLDYLAGIGERMVAYDVIRSTIAEYVLENDIDDLDLATDLFVVGFIWEAAQRGEVLLESELTMLLGADENFDEDQEFNTYILDDDNIDLSLEELLDRTVDSYYEPQEEDDIDEDDFDE